MSKQRRSHSARFRVLGIASGEEDSHVRKDHAPRNLALLRRLALNFLEQETSLKVGVKARRLRAGWDAPCLKSFVRPEYAVALACLHSCISLLIERDSRL
jgi:hypothetical protein